MDADQSSSDSGPGRKVCQSKESMILRVLGRQCGCAGIKQVKNSEVGGTEAEGSEVNQVIAVKLRRVKQKTFEMEDIDAGENENETQKNETKESDHFEDYD